MSFSRVFPKIFLIAGAFLLLPWVLCDTCRAETEVTIGFDFPRGEIELEPDADPTDPGQTVTDILIDHAVLPVTLPRLASERSGDEEKETAEEEAAIAEEEWLNQFGPVISYEYFSNDEAHKTGSIYGVSGSYEREWGGLRTGGVLEYKFFDMDQLGAHPNTNRILGVLFLDYLILEEPLTISAGANMQGSYSIQNLDMQDYGTLGGGAFVSIGKDFEFLEVTVGAVYQYTKYWIDQPDDQSHLVRYGGIVGVPIGRKLSANVFFTQTRNPTDYQREIFDRNFFTLGAEGIFAFTRSWVASLGYRTVLDYKGYSSHQVYLGTLVKF